MKLITAQARVLTPWLLAILVSVSVNTLWAAPQTPNTWKVNFRDQDIRDFIAEIATITNKTFVVDPRVKGKVTVASSTDLNQQGVYELFLSVLRVSGYAAVQTGDVTKIVQNTLAKQSGQPLKSWSDKEMSEEVITQVIPVRNVASIELAKILRPMIPQYGNISSTTQPNAIIVSDHAQNIDRLRSIVERLDVVSDEKMLVVNLKDAFVGNVVALLEKIAPDQLGTNSQGNGPARLRVVANETNNSLIMMGEASSLNKVKNIIQELDKPASKSGSTQVIFLRHADAAKTAEILNNLIQGDQQQEQSQAAGGKSDPKKAVTIQADESLNALVVKAGPDLMAEVKSLVQQLDVRRIQVLIEAAIVEVTDSLNEALGTDIVIADRGGSSIPLSATGLTGNLANVLGSILGSSVGIGDGDGMGGGNVGNGITGVGSLTRPTIAAAKTSNDGINFALLIQALDTNSQSNLLSTPSILTLDNQEASIIVGQTVPFRTGSSVSGSNGAENPFTTITREDIGIMLKVTPHINEGSVVRLEVEQEVSAVLPTNIGTGGLSDIITSKRTIKTTILADDSETILLGGLISDDTNATQNRIPWLSDMPILGKLFRNTTEDRVKRNLIVFLKPTILKGSSDVATLSRSKFKEIYEVEIIGKEDFEVLYRGKPGLRSDSITVDF